MVDFYMYVAKKQLINPNKQIIFTKQQAQFCNLLIILRINTLDQKQKHFLFLIIFLLSKKMKIIAFSMIFYLMKDLVFVPLVITNILTIFIEKKTMTLKLV